MSLRGTQESDSTSSNSLGDDMVHFWVPNVSRDFRNRSRRKRPRSSTMWNALQARIPPLSLVMLLICCANNPLTRCADARTMMSHGWPNSTRRRYGLACLTYPVKVGVAVPSKSNYSSKALGLPKTLVAPFKTEEIGPCPLQACPVSSLRN
jgi:hypothetical protein